MSFTPFPEEWELIGLFECEPVLTDPGIPWCYNHLTFVSVRGCDTLHCEMSPSSHNLKFKWCRNDIEQLSLDLGWVQGLTVDTSNGVEALQLYFPGASDIVSIRLQFKPTIQCCVINSKDHF